MVPEEVLRAEEEEMEKEEEDFDEEEEDDEDDDEDDDEEDEEEEQEEEEKEEEEIAEPRRKRRKRRKGLRGILRSNGSPAERFQLLGFHIHMVVYLSINAFLVAINLLQIGSGKISGIPWSVWPLLGWGSVVAIHYGVTYSIFLALGYETDTLDEIATMAIYYGEKYGEPLAHRLLEGIAPLSKGNKTLREIVGRAVDSFAF